MLRMPQRRSTATRTGRIARGVAHQLGEWLPEREQFASLTRRTAVRLVPGQRRAAARAAARRRRWWWLSGTVGLAGTGLLAGWLAASKRATPTWRTVRAPLAKAAEQLVPARSGDGTPAATSPSGGAVAAGKTAGGRDGEPAQPRRTDADEHAKATSPNRQTEHTGRSPG